MLHYLIHCIIISFMLLFRESLSIYTFPANAPPLVRLLYSLRSRLIFCISDRLITSKDFASVQISIADVDANGRALNTSTTFALCGQVRSQGEGDDSVNRLATKAGCKLLSWYMRQLDAELTSQSAPECVLLSKVIARVSCCMSSHYTKSSCCVVCDARDAIRSGFTALSLY